MNCRNCGAPMRPVENRDYLTCPYCGTFHFPGPLADSADRVVPLAERTDVGCPACDLPLMHGAVEGVRVLFCETCRGVLADSDSFAMIVQCRRAHHTGPPQQPRPIDPVELERQLICPACRHVMDVHPYYGPGNVVIDSCSHCQLVWLDHGEIAAIERAPGRR